MRYWLPFLLIGLCLSCQAPLRRMEFIQEAAARPQTEEPGLIVILSGIEGPGWATRRIAGGLRDAGLCHTIVTYDWTTGDWCHTLDHLCGETANRQAAGELAQRLLAYRLNHPGKPVTLIGISGGAGIALWTLEALPVSYGNCQAILLGPGVSPWFDLVPALQRTDRGLYCFRSALDCFILGIGTSVLGTMDRHWTPAAGTMGFIWPDQYQQASWYESRLIDFPHSRVMSSFGHYGFHTSWSSRSLIEHVVAPLVAK